MIGHPRERLAAALREYLLPIAAIFLVSRIVLLLLANVAFAHFGADVADTGWTGLLCRWDCGWYLRIAEHGYSTRSEGEVPGTTTYAFFPLLPLATHAFAQVTGTTLLQAGLVISNSCFSLALIYVYRYARLIGADRNGALLAVALLCVLPLSIAFSAYLTESLFMLLLAMAMFHLRRGDFLIAAIAAALLSAVRANGILFIIFALALAWRRDGWRSFASPWREPERFLPLVFAPLGIFAFWAFCFATTGDAFAQATTAHHGWSWTFYPVWNNLPAMLHSDGPQRLAAICGICAFACALLLLRQRLYEEFFVCTAFILLVLSGTGTVSLFRYWIVLFPIWIAVARALAMRPVLAGVVYALIGLLGGASTCAWALQKEFAL